MQKIFKLSLMAVLVGALSACDSSSGDNSDDIVPDDSTSDNEQVIISGSLVAPESISDSTEASSTSSTLRVTCSDIPSGYVALNDASVSLQNTSGEILKEDIKSDACGAFDISVDKELAGQITQLLAEKSGFKTISSDINNFLEGSELKVASTISSDSSYEISGLRLQSENKANITVTDSSTHKAVIGLLASSLTFEKNDSELTNVTLTGSQSVTDNEASIVISLDSSGSMTSLVKNENNEYIEDAEGNQLSRYEIAATAAHQFVDTTKDNDAEANFSVLLFSSIVYPLSDDLINDKLTLKNENSEEILFESEREYGFIKDSAILHTLIDIYNPYSEMYIYPYSYSHTVERHEARTDDIVSIDNSYPFGGGTAFYNSLDTALDQFSNTTKNPKVIALTDGLDNGSNVSYEEVIVKALDLNVPISVVAAGSGLDSYGRMEAIATETGSQYLEVTDISQLSGFFDGLSTQSTFNYNVSLGESLESGDTLKVTLDLNGEGVSRELTVN